MRSTSLLLLASLAQACSSTTAGTNADATDVVTVDAASPIDAPPADTLAPVDVQTPPDVATDVPPGACRWVVGEAVELNVTGDRSSRRILDVKPAEGGAWVLTSDDAGTSRQPDTTLERLDPTGHRRPSGTVRITGSSPAFASLAIDEALGRRAILEEQRANGSGTCGFIALDATGNPSARRAVMFPGGGFSLTGCRDLLANRAGFTFLSDQVRALWGVSMVQLDPTGATPTQMAPGLLTIIPEVPYTRFAFSDRSFMFLWKSSMTAQAATPRLQAQRFNEDGTMRAMPQTVQETAHMTRGFVATETGDGMLALWEETVDTLPMLYGIAVRSLDANGQARGAVRVLTELGFYQGGLAATFARGDVLATGITGSGVLRPVVVPLAADGSSRGAILGLPVPQGAALIADVRIVTTSTGALVVYTTDPMQYPNRLVAVPLTCAR